MKKTIFLLLLIGCCIESRAQFIEKGYREGWDNIPPQAQKKGFWLQKSVLVNMDDDPALEEVMLFGRDLGHYPTFDLFEVYYAIVDHYTKEVQYVSDKNYITNTLELIVEDRNQDGIHELYRKYFKDNKYSVDKRGYKLSVIWCYDRVEWLSENSKLHAK